MKKSSADTAQLHPHSHGWRLRHGEISRDVANLDEVIAFLPGKARLHIAIPSDMALAERLTLPSTDRDELIGMAQLQLEKTLPYPIEEVASDFELLSTGESESTVLSIAVPIDPLNALCGPLLSHRRIPQKVTLFAQHIGVKCPAGETVLAVWKEGEQVAVAIFDDRKLAWLHSLPEAEPEATAGELCGLLIGAEMEGAPTKFTAMYMDEECADLVPAFQEQLQVPYVTFSTADALEEPSLNLLPAAWVEETRRAERGEVLRQRLIQAGLAYLVIMAAAFVYLAFKKHAVQGIERKIAAIEPAIQATKERQDRWAVLAPAVDPGLSAVEVLYLVDKNRPQGDIKITTFEYSPTQFMVEGETSAANLVIEYLERLRKETALSAYRFEDGHPNILPTTVQFKIYGKL